MRLIIHVVGNRPQFVKLAVLHKAIQAHAGAPQFIIHTGQHFSSDMSDIFFEQLQIPAPDITLNLQHPQPDTYTGMAASAIAEVLRSQQQRQPLVMVYGDTNTTLAGALAAQRQRMPLLHFEAGVRNADLAMPEEINRILTDRLAGINYCCTDKNYRTLLAEGYGSAIGSLPLLTGDLMYDAFLQIPAADTPVPHAKHYVACTIHRNANITNPLALTHIVKALNIIHQQSEVIVPLHPHTAKRLQEYGIVPDFTTINPLGYGQMKCLLANASYVITDSGGSSREAFFMQKKSVIVMKEPFWPEITEAKAAIACEPDCNLILDSFNKLPGLSSDFETPIFGNGHAARNIAEHIKSLL